MTRERRFAAAIPVAPISNWVSQQLTSHGPEGCEHYVRDRLDNLGGAYFTRSPVLHARGATTPTLTVCGALDLSTPPGQAVELHQALRQQGVRSVLVTYPLEGHGVRTWPASFDFGARVVEWFDAHLRAGAERS